VFGRTFAIQTFDGGVHWSDATTLFPQGGLMKIIIHNGNIWVIHWGRTPNLSVSKDTCATWIPDTIGDGSSISDLVFLDDSIGFACGDQRYIGKTEDGGKTWKKMSDSLGMGGGVFQKMCFPSPNKGLAISLTGSIAKTDDLSAQWLWSTGVSGQLNVIHFFNGDSGFILGSWNPTICLKTGDGGTNWFVNSTTIFPQVTAVSFPQKDRGVGVCWNGAIHSIHGFFDSTREITANTGWNLRCADFCDSLHGLAGSIEDGTLFLTGDAGVTWVKSIAPDSVGIQSITGFSNGRVILKTAYNEFISPDFGHTWTVSANSSVFIRIFKKEPFSLEAYAIDSGKKLFYSQDAGVSWKALGTISFSNLQLVDGLRRVYFSSPKKGWALSLHGSVSRTEDSGYTWYSMANIPENISVSDLFFYDESHGWVCGSWYINNNPVMTVYPLIFFTADGGATWIKQANLSFYDNLAIPTDIQFQASMLKIRSHDLSVIWGLFDRGVIASFDTGKSWKQQTVPQYGKLFWDMFVSQNGDMYVIGDNSRIWKYTADEGTIGIRNPRIGLHTSKGTVRSTSPYMLYDIKGRMLGKYAFKSGNGIGSLKKSGTLSTGIYFLRPEEKSNLGTIKIVIP
jgi:photosystem II stability/assembly factor-like uncharacterized protein